MNFIGIHLDSILVHVVHLIVGMLIATLWQKFKKSQEEQDAIKMGLQSLLRGEITKAYYKYKEKGYVPLYALESIEGNYRNYKALGVDGVIDRLWNEFLALPHIKEENGGDTR